MYWTVHLYGGPRRVNHAAVAIGDIIFTFGGYCSGIDYNTFKPIDIHVLDTGNCLTFQLFLILTNKNYIILIYYLNFSKIELVEIEFKKSRQ